jgi:hypothetical protein
MSSTATDLDGLRRLRALKASESERAAKDENRKCGENKKTRTENALGAHQ